MLAEQPDRWRFFRGRFPGQLEVAIRRHHAFGETDGAGRGIRALDLDGVMMAFHLAEREAGLQMNRDPGRIDRRVLRGIEHRRRDAIAVGDRINMARAPAVAAGAEVDALHDGCGIIARADHHRHPQRKLAAVLLHRLLIFDLHQHGFSGADIGDGIGEDVRPLLLGQRGLAPGPLRLFVDRAGLLPLLDVADDDAVADHHLQRVDRAAWRQRIDVSRLHPVLGRIAEDLRDAGADGRT